MARLTEKEVEGAYCRYFKIIWEKCTRMLRDSDEAKDVAQETFFRLCAKRTSIENPRAITSWIYRTSTRLAIDYFRVKKRQGPFSNQCIEESKAQAVSDPESIALSRRMLDQIMHKLPSRELEIALLSRLDGLSHEEIGEVIGKSDRTVRRLLRRLDHRLEQLNH